MKKQKPIEQTDCILFSVQPQFHIVAINEKTNRKEYLTNYPMLQDACLVMVGKSRPAKDVRIQLEPSKPKSYYQALDYDGYKWGFFEGIHHTFSRQSKGSAYGFEVIKATEDDLHNGNIEYFVANGMSR